MTKKVFIYLMISLLAIQISEHIFNSKSHRCASAKSQTEIPANEQSLNHYISHYFSVEEKVIDLNILDTIFFLNTLIPVCGGCSFAGWVWKPPKC